jgi:phage tail-like protein
LGIIEGLSTSHILVEESRMRRSMILILMLLFAAAAPLAWAQDDFGADDETQEYDDSAAAYDEPVDEPYESDSAYDEPAHEPIESDQDVGDSGDWTDTAEPETDYSPAADVADSWESDGADSQVQPASEEAMAPSGDNEWASTPDPAATPWPIASFRWRVEFPGVGEGMFQEVSGLVDVGAQEIEEYRPGNSQAARRPGKYTATMMKGVFINDERWSRFAQITDAAAGTPAAAAAGTPVTISLLDETGSPIMKWTLTGAVFPSRPVVKSSGNEILVETITINFENLAVGQ